MKCCVNACKHRHKGTPEDVVTGTNIRRVRTWPRDERLSATRVGAECCEIRYGRHIGAVVFQFLGGEDGGSKRQSKNGTNLQASLGPGPRPRSAHAPH